MNIDKKIEVVELKTWSHELSIHPTHGSRRHGGRLNFDQQEEPIFYEGVYLYIELNIYLHNT